MTASNWPLAMVTGHRPQHLQSDPLDWIDDQLRRIAARLRAECGTRTLISGMALGVDTLWANVAVRARMPLAAYIPFLQQPDIWTDPYLREEWKWLVAYAERTGGVFPSGDHPAGAPKADAIRILHKRNADMIAATVAAGGACLAVLRSSRLVGGTRSAYWKAAGVVPIIRVDPDLRTVTIAQPTPQAAIRHEQETLL